MGLNLFSRKRRKEVEEERCNGPVAVLDPPPPRVAPPASVWEAAEPVSYDADSLRRQLQLERYGIILTNHSHWREHPDLQAVYQAASQAVDSQFALVPEGFVSLPRTVDDSPGCPELDMETASFFLSRYAVTNAQFQKFVDVGAYEELEMWPEEIWPHLIDFKDLTDRPGPRFWRDGRHNRLLADHPVVGICWFEAAVYARWAGYRLPSEAEWQMAASWRIRSCANVLRRYPWGDAFDGRRCNVWASGVGRTVPVDEYEWGAAPNGVRQLVGNVWEWTYCDFEATDEQGNPVLGDMLMKSIRGGAFDTYFAAQATSCFRTGLAALTRAHNVGFHCAMDLPTSGGPTA